METIIKINTNIKGTKKTHFEMDAEEEDLFLYFLSPMEPRG
jgi:hypothetical protein